MDNPRQNSGVFEMGILAGELRVIGTCKSVKPEVQLRLNEIADSIAIMERRIENKERILDALPDCPTHGRGCLTHSIEWIEKVKVILKQGGYDV